MSVINKTVKYNALDVNLKFSLGSDIQPSGYQQEIDNITVKTEYDLLNPISDVEVRRFKYMPTIQASNLVFNFYDITGNTHVNSFIAAGFASNEISINNNSILNSFFILDFYDSFDPNIQTKIFSTYLTKVIMGQQDSITKLQIPKYRIYSDTSNQLYYWHIPQSFINEQTSNIINAYVKFSFYNAKKGIITLFYNKDNEQLTTPEHMYFKVEVNLANMTWRILTSSFPTLVAYEVIPNEYVARINNTINTTDNKKQNYPNGNAFQRESGTYTTE